MAPHSCLWHLLALLPARGCIAAGGANWPLNLKLSPKASGMQGLRSVYSVDITVGRVGPLTLLVDTGSPAVVVQGDFGDGGSSATSFLGTDGAGSATIHYGGATVRGDVRRSRMCFDDAAAVGQDQSKGGDVCLMNFPVFEMEKGDSGFDQMGLDGVLGLGPATGEANLALKGMDETVLDGLANAGSGVPRIFGLYISPGSFFGSSTLTLGGYDSTKIISGAGIQYVPLAQPTTGRWELNLQALRLAPADGSPPESIDVCQGRGDCRVLLDSGTAQIASVPQLADALGSKVRNADAEGCVELREMPDLHIEFAGGVVVKLGPEEYVLDRGMCTLAVEEMSAEELSRAKSLALILGEPFLRKVYAVFDQEQGRVGLAPSVATQGQQTRNEERRKEEKKEQAEHASASLMNYISGR